MYSSESLYVSESQISVNAICIVSVSILIFSLNVTSYLRNQYIMHILCNQYFCRYAPTLALPQKS